MSVTGGFEADIHMTEQWHPGVDPRKWPTTDEILAAYYAYELPPDLCEVCGTELDPERCACGYKQHICD